MYTVTALQVEPVMINAIEFCIFSDGVICFVFHFIYASFFFLDPPTVQVQQSSYSVNTGNTVTLVCTVSSSLPITNVYWQRNIGGSITTITNTNTNKYSGSTTTTPSLTIFSVQQSDVGTYTCYGSNSVGTDQSSTTLSVTGGMHVNGHYRSYLILPFC